MLEAVRNLATPNELATGEPAKRGLEPPVKRG